MVTVSIFVSQVGQSKRGFGVPVQEFSHPVFIVEIDGDRVDFVLVFRVPMLAPDHDFVFMHTIALSRRAFADSTDEHRWLGLRIVAMVVVRHRYGVGPSEGGEYFW